MASISDEDYNKARAILAKAGSKSAAKSHEKHTQGKGSPQTHGTQLLQEARDEFNTFPEAKMKTGRAAVVQAAKVMGIARW